MSHYAAMAVLDPAVLEPTSRLRLQQTPDKLSGSLRKKAPLGSSWKADSGDLRRSFQKTYGAEELTSTMRRYGSAGRPPGSGPDVRIGAQGGDWPDVLPPDTVAQAPLSPMTKAMHEGGRRPVTTSSSKRPLDMAWLRQRRHVSDRRPCHIKCHEYRGVPHESVRRGPISDFVFQHRYKSGVEHPYGVHECDRITTRVGTPPFVRGRRGLAFDVAGGADPLIHDKPKRPKNAHDWNRVSNSPAERPKTSESAFPARGVGKTHNITDLVAKISSSSDSQTVHCTACTLPKMMLWEVAPIDPDIQKQVERSAVMRVGPRT